MRYTGGLVACLVRYSQMRYCYNTGDVTNINEDTEIMVGGLCGELSLESTSSLVESCYNIGRVSCNQSNTGKLYVGQLFGEVHEKSTGRAANTYYLNSNENIKAYGGNVKSDYETIAKNESELKSDEIVEILNSTITESDIEKDTYDKKEQPQEELDEKLYPQEAEKQNNKEEKAEVPTTANTDIPQAGSNIEVYIMVAIIVTFILMIYIRNRKYSNIK